MREDIAGKYSHERSASHYLELNGDGSYVLFEGQSRVTGTYVVNGTELTVFGADSTSKAKIQDGVITDTEGDRWVRSDMRRQVVPAAVKTTQPPQQVPAPADDGSLDSITWLPAFLKQELPWELFEAIVAAAALIVVSIATTHS